MNLSLVESNSNLFSSTLLKDVIKNDASPKLSILLLGIYNVRTHARLGLGSCSKIWNHESSLPFYNVIPKILLKGIAKKIRTGLPTSNPDS